MVVVEREEDDAEVEDLQYVDDSEEKLFIVSDSECQATFKNSKYQPKIIICKITFCLFLVGGMLMMFMPTNTSFLMPMILLILICLGATLFLKMRTNIVTLISLTLLGVLTISQIIIVSVSEMTAFSILLIWIITCLCIYIFYSMNNSRLAFTLKHCFEVT